MSDSSDRPAVQYPVAQGPRTGMGPTALVLGAIGMVFGLFPATFFLAIPLGVAGFVLGRVGHRRCVIGKATNGRIAMAGSIISGAAVVLGCFGAVIVFTDLLD